MISLIIPPVLVLIVIAMAFTTIKRRFIGSLILVVCAFILNWMGHVFPVNLSSNNDEVADISVISWNIHGSGDGFVERAIGISDRIKTISPDVVYLTEDFDGGRNVINSLLKKSYPYSNIATNKMGNVVYSKFPIDTIIYINPETDSPYFIFDSRLKVGDGIVSVFCCHLSSNNYNADNDYLTPDQIEGHSGIKQYYKSLSYGFNSRKIETNAINDAIDRTLPTIVMGDMNEPSGANLDQLQGLKDAWWEGGFGYGATIHHPLPFRIDHIMYNDGLELVDIKKVDSQGLSDHDALVASFRIKK